MPGTHSEFSPSSAERWCGCPGSVALCREIPAKPANAYMAEGTVAHKLGQDLLEGKTDDLHLMARIGDVVEQEGHDIEITEEMYDAVVFYRDSVKEELKTQLLMDPRPAPVVEKTEARVCAKSIDPDLWGTCDYVAYRRGHRLIVRDYKHGKGHAVDVRQNKQLLIYSIGAMDGDAGWAFDEVDLGIIQPRAPHADGPDRKWALKTSEMKRWAGYFRERIAAAKAPDAPLQSGSWCTFCPARAHCPEIHKSVQERAKADFSVIPVDKTGGLPDPRLLPVNKVADALRWEKVIESWYEALKLRAREVLEGGGEVPGFKLVPKRAVRTWKDETEVVKQFGKLYGDQLYKRDMLSVAQLEKLVGKKQLPANLWQKVSNGTSIAPATDSRPEARRSVEKDFGVIETKPDPKTDLLALEAEILGPVWPK